MNTASIKPIPLWESILLFGIPGMVLYFTIEYGVPYIDQKGVPLIFSFTLALYGPLGLLIPASIIAYKLEGNEMSWSAFKKRFRLKAIQGKAWLWIIGIYIVVQIFEQMLSFTGKILASVPFFSPPKILPDFMNPTKEIIFPPIEFMGMPLEGNWWIALLFAVCLFFNMFGEEFWWRGYILPRQEIRHGKWTWLIHGVLWNLFHVFWKWNLIALILPALSVSFVAYKLKNTTPGIIAHWIQNGLGLIMILLGVLGIAG